MLIDSTASGGVKSPEAFFCLSQLCLKLNMSKIVLILAFGIIFFLIDLYVYQGVKFLLQGANPLTKRIIFCLYWGVFVLTNAGFLTYHFADSDQFSWSIRVFMMVGIFVNFLSKVVFALFLMLDDIIRFVKWSSGLVSNPKSVETPEGLGITRSDFLVKTALVAGSVPILVAGYGILSGAHDYRVRRHKVFLPNLPASFDGIKIAQISDIHSGSFFNKTAVKGGVEMLLKEKPDMIFFTGDLVNNKATELNDYFDVFSKIKAPLGVYSTLGNHDYGDYVDWDSPEAKRANLNLLIEGHRQMGWDILMNEHRFIEQNGDKLAIIGVENWGGGGFAKHGDLDKAYKGSADAAVKLLLSHDPSHWDAKVRPQYKDIDISFAGHTHGFQFGIELGDFKWSPAQYRYKQWAGLYQQEQQYLYVNRGFGFLAFPGRVGMPPEITVMELKKG